MKTRMIFFFVLAGIFFTFSFVQAAALPVKKSGYLDFGYWYKHSYLANGLPVRTVAVLDFETLEPLYYHGELNVMPTASLMKLITAGTFVQDQTIDWDSLVGVSWWDNEGDLRKYVGPNDRYVLLRLEENERIPVRDMFASMMIASANNAANRLATLSGGTLSKFISRMRETAKKWGLESTQIAEPSGLSLDNLSNAKDMALAVCQALRDERISNVAMLPSYDFEQVLGRPYKIQHTVYEIRNRSSQYFGAKTGFLYETRFHTAAGLVSPQGKKLCVALLSGQTRAESEELLPAIGEWADQMYSWAGQSVL